MPETENCSQSSRHSGEQLFATAARADYWLLLECNEPYGAQALSESGLPSNVRAHLEAGAAALPNSRIQLIKRGREAAGGGIAFFVGVNHEERPNLYEFRLFSYRDLLDLDLEAVAAEDRAYRAHDRTDPLFLVCTNGRRDPCCASLGLPLFRVMQQAGGDSVWQVSHVGGHRFAPNLVVLPHGAYYGYVDPESADRIRVAHGGGRMHLPNYRGRSCYEKDVQAAETLLRQVNRLDVLNVLKLVEIEKLSDWEAVYHFSDLRAERHYCVRLLREERKVEVLKSCRDEAPGRTDFYRLLESSVHEGVRRIEEN